jgi:DNA-binding GntR family transcriptional regulator
VPTRKSNTAAPRTSLCDKAYNDIKRRILTNQISPGNMIDDRKIALEIGMSRTPVREALLRLQAEELVEMSPRRGTIVLGISRDDMREIYDIISGLELMAVDLNARGRCQE